MPGWALPLLLAMGRHRRQLQAMKREALLALEPLKRFFSVNSNIFIRTLCLTFVFAFFTDRSAAESTEVLAVNQMLLQFLFLMSYGIDGFAYAAESLVGRFTGSREGDKLRQSIRLLMIWGMAVGLGYSLVYGLGGKWMLAQFTPELALQQEAWPYLNWLVALPLLSAAAFMWDGVYIGATATRALRNAMLIVTFGLFLPAYLLTSGWGNHGIWFAMSLFMLGRGVFLWIFAKKAIYF
ncbi:MAG: MATE family efflux transporter [Bacteroidia bacterium]